MWEAKNKKAKKRANSLNINRASACTLNEGVWPKEYTLHTGRETELE